MIVRPLIVVGIAMSAALGVVLGRWVTDRNYPTVNLQTTVLDPVVRPGGEVRVRYRVERYRRDCAINVDRLLYDADSARYVLEDRSFSGAPGPVGTDSYVVPVQIPATFAQGVGTYRTITRFICNPIHMLWPLVTPEDSVTFLVAGAPVQPGARGPAGPQGLPGPQGVTGPAGRSPP